jgi:DNA-binding Lrp family transcriptional regulator
MKRSKAYVLINLGGGEEVTFFSRLQELGLASRVYDCYRVFGSGSDYILELVHEEWEELDEFFYLLQSDKVLRQCVEDESRMISVDKDFEYDADKVPVQ